MGSGSLLNFLYVVIIKLDNLDQFTRTRAFSSIISEFLTKYKISNQSVFLIETCTNNYDIWRSETWVIGILREGVQCVSRQSFSYLTLTEPVERAV